jgi:hypothetical protein
MSRGAHSFTQSDLTKAMKAAAKSGVNWRIEIVPGKIIMVPGAPASAPDTKDDNEWDSVK